MNNKTYYIYIIERFGNCYQSSCIDSVDNYEQACDKLHELRCQTGSTGYIEEVNI